MKLSILAILGAMMLVTPACAQDTAASYLSEHAGKRYDFTVTHAQLQLTPDWAEDADNPPLSPRKALAHARADLRMFLPDAAKWIHPKIILTEVGAPHKWMYIVEFEGPLPPNMVDGPVDRMRVLVLMNGIAIKPVITSPDH
ncbi:MAG: hypothetical protein M3Y13_04085 [Armatimonadota bacterium]|nr:hypothetical protein [Armatimonadota bacterium]